MEGCRRDVPNYSMLVHMCVPCSLVQGRDPHLGVSPLCESLATSDE